MIKSADLIFTRSKHSIGKYIRWFNQAKGEGKTYTNHTAGIGLYENVVEAQTTVISTPFEEWKEGKIYQLWRSSDVDEMGAVAVANYVEAQRGRPYGAAKLAFHAMDGFLSKITGGNPFLFRRLLFRKDYPICSWLWTYGYDQIHLRFGSDPRKLSPDGMHDYCIAHPDKWTMIHEQA